MINENIFVFDIETIPDIESARSVLKMKDESDDEVYTAIAAYQDDSKPREKVFLKAIFHKVVAISFAEIKISNDYGKESFSLQEIRTGGNEDSTEKELLQGVFKYLESKTPRLVSFNGRAFDFPVLKLRAMKHNISTNLHKLGDKWNSYNQRYSKDWHCDLHETLTDYFACGRLKLDEACRVFGYPGKIDVDGSSVYELYQKGKIKEIRDYCETDVMNTYLVYLSYSLHYGNISLKSYENSVEELQIYLKNYPEKEHFKKFLEAME